MKKTLYLNGKNYDHLYIDTCALMHSGFENCMRMLAPLLQYSNLKLTIIDSVVAELKRFEIEKSDRSKRAQRALENISALQSVGLIGIENVHERTNTPDSCFVKLALQARSNHEKILLLTQDYSLAQDVLSINNIRSQMGPAANVKRLAISGALEDFDLNRPVTMRPMSASSVAYNATQAVLKRFGL